MEISTLYYKREYMYLLGLNEQNGKVWMENTNKHIFTPTLTFVNIHILITIFPKLNKNEDA